MKCPFCQLEVPVASDICPHCRGNLELPRLLQELQDVFHNARTSLTIVFDGLEQKIQRLEQRLAKPVAPPLPSPTPEMEHVFLMTYRTFPARIRR